MSKKDYSGKEEIEGERGARLKSFREDLPVLTKASFVCARAADGILLRNVICIASQNVQSSNYMQTQSM